MKIKKFLILSLLIIGIFSFFSTVNASNNTLVDIDFPTNNEVAIDSVLIRGWVMSEESNVDVEIYIDNNEIINEIDRHEREDVLQLISGYGGRTTNITPGYQTTLNLSEYNYGEHKVTVKAVKDGRVLGEESRVFNKKAPSTMISIDIPSNNEKITNDKMTVKGWVMSEYENPTLEVYLDNQKQEVVFDRHKRADVIQAITGYGSASINTNPGYMTDLDVSNLDYGTHEVKVIAKDSSGKTLYEETRKFSKKKPETKISIDDPSSNKKVNRSFHISGWVMSEDKDRYIEIAIDDVKVNTEITNKEREDVLAAIDGCGGKENNPLPGYSTNIDLSNYLDGEHKLTVSVYSKTGKLIMEETRKFRLEKYNSTINITTPTNNTYKTTLDINGYVLSEVASTSLDLYFDNTLIASNITRSSLGNIEDSIYNEYGGKENNLLPNFNYSYNTTDISDGKHTITLKLKLDTGEVIKEKTQQFNIKKYDSLITVDFPNSNNINKKDNLFIRGWVMSEDKDTTVKIYLDNQEVKELVDRHEREDVLLAINGYGGRATNTLPGYSTLVDLTNYAAGYHTLTIKTFNHLNEEFNTYSKTIYIYDGFELGIDVSEHNGSIDWNTVKNSGGVDFAMLRIGFRGYASAGNMKLDARFIDNFNGATNNNIKTGVYFFSQATNYGEGVAEADFVINTFNMNPGFKDRLKMPIVLDVEYSTEGHGNGRADQISNEARTDAVKGFIDRMNMYGYRPTIYANKDFLTNKLDLSKWSNYDVWLAHWTYDFNKNSDYTGTYAMWQYSNSGSVAGINGAVDLDVSYFK